MTGRRTGTQNRPSARALSNHPSQKQTHLVQPPRRLALVGHLQRADTAQVRAFNASKMKEFLALIAQTGPCAETHAKELPSEVSSTEIFERNTFGLRNRLAMTRAA